MTGEGATESGVHGRGALLATETPADIHGRVALVATGNGAHGRVEAGSLRPYGFASLRQPDACGAGESVATALAEEFGRDKRDPPVRVVFDRDPWQGCAAIPQRPLSPNLRTETPEI